LVAGRIAVIVSVASRRESMVEGERMLITVRTYPDLSTKHIETVCTAGVTASGQWRRLYPVPLRCLPEMQRYRTWDIRLAAQ
jgi:hypothetical protein